MKNPDGPLTPEAERALMRRLIAGDEEAIRTLYARFSRPVFGLGLRLLGSVELAEELTQDTFVQAWRKAGRYDPARGRLSTWLMTIAHNLGVDRLRRETKRAAVPMEDVEELLEGTGQIDDEVLDHVRAIRILGHLAAGDRRLLLLSYFRGWTAKEIAEHDGIPLGTVKTRLRSALIKLRRAEAWKREP